MKEYVFNAYDTRFPAIFTREKTKIRRILPFAIKIEHFGSTAVPELGGKGIVDIYVLVPVRKFELAKEKLTKSKVGYSFYNSKKIDGSLKMIFRRQFKYSGKIRKINLHIGTVGIKDFDKCIAFRNALRSSKNLCKKYKTVKRLAVKKTKDSGEDNKENSKIYVNAKNAFMQSYEKYLH